MEKHIPNLFSLLLLMYQVTKEAICFDWGPE